MSRLCFFVKLLLLIIVMAAPGNCIAQSGNFIGMRSSIGFVLPHGSSMRHLVQGHAKTIELDFSSEIKGFDKQWYSSLSKPRQGIAFYHMNSGNTKEIGSISALYGYIDFPIFRSKSWLNYLKFGSGISYVQNHFDITQNYRNVAIGSSFNMGFVFAYHIERSFNKFRIGTGFSVVHSSSGAYRLPNLGLNTPSFDITLKYQVNSIRTKTVILNDSLDSNIHFDVLLSSGIRSTDVLNKRKRMVHTFQFDARKKNYHVFGYNGGIDVFYNEAIAFLDEDASTNSPIIQLGAKIGVDLILDNKTIYLQMGKYLLNESNKDGGFYHRFGGRMVIRERVIANFSLKTHFAKADYFEIGIGYRWR